MCGMDLRILQYPSWSFDRGDVSVNVEILWDPMHWVTGFSSVPVEVAHTGIQRTLERKLQDEEWKNIWVIQAKGIGVLRSYTSGEFTPGKRGCAK